MVCVRCGATVGEGDSLCLTCTQQGHQVLKCDFIKSTVTFFPIGTVLESPHDHPDGRKIDSRPASGGRSVSKISGKCAYKVDLSGSLEPGRPNEKQVMKVLKQLLEAEGKDVSPRNDAQDDRGVDGVMDINGNTVEVQIVTLPAGSSLWYKLANDQNVSLIGDRYQAVSLIRDALERKANKYKGDYLVHDSSHEGVFADTNLVDGYISKYGNPADEFSIKEVFIIGPTVKSSIRLGAATQPAR